MCDQHRPKREPQATRYGNMYRNFKPPFFWPEQYRRTGGMSIVFLFDENPDVARAARAAQRSEAREVCRSGGSRWQPVFGSSDCLE